MNKQNRYPECATLTTTGSGTGVPSTGYLTAIPGVYSMSDPEINIDIYSNANADVTVCIFYNRTESDKDYKSTKIKNIKLNGFQKLTVFDITDLDPSGTSSMGWHQLW